MWWKAFMNSKVLRDWGSLSPLDLCFCGLRSLSQNLSVCLWKHAAKGSCFSEPDLVPWFHCRYPPNMDSRCGQTRLSVEAYSTRPQGSCWESLGASIWPYFRPIPLFLLLSVTTSLAPPAGWKWLTRRAWSSPVLMHNKLSPNLEA